MERTTLTRGLMLLAMIIAAAAVVWSLLPAPRTVRLSISGLPEWGITTVRFGRQTAAAVEPGVYEATVRTGERKITITGGLEEPCQRCCFTLSQPVEVAFDTANLALSARVPECPAADYVTRRVEPGEVTIEGQAVLSRRAIFVGEPISPELWRWGGIAEGCGEEAVGCVTWLDAVRFANQLSIAEGLTPAYYHDAAHLFPYSERGGPIHWRREAGGWRLPTEPEWLLGVGEASRAEWTWDAFTSPYAGVSRTQEADGPRTTLGPARVARVAPDADLGFRLVRDVPPPPDDDGEARVRPPRERR
jgi:hypothetical protein